MSKLLEMAQAIGADFALIVEATDRYPKDTRFYKNGNWQGSRNCMLRWNEERERWDNTSELSFGNIERGLKWNKRPYSIVDFRNKSRKQVGVK